MCSMKNKIQMRAYCSRIVTEYHHQYLICSIYVYMFCYRFNPHGNRSNEDKAVLVTQDSEDGITELDADNGQYVSGSRYSTAQRCCTCSKRTLVAVMSCIGFCISFGIRCNLGVAIVDMTTNNTVHINGKREVHVSIFKEF